MMKYIVTTVIILQIAFSSDIIGQKSKKWQEAINQLEKSEFVQEHQKNKVAIEESITYFLSTNKNKKDIEAVRLNYIICKEKFDVIFDRMIVSFTNKKNRKFIIRDPDWYFNGFRSDVNEAMQTYRNTCERQIHEMVNLEEAAFGLTEITILISLIKELSGIVSNHIKKMNKMSADYFETNFVAKQRLKDWESY